MLTTSLAILILGGLTVVLLLLSAGFLRIGARWAKAPALTYGRAVATVLLISVAVCLARGAVLFGRGFLQHNSYMVLAAGLVLEMIASWIIVQRMLRVSFGKAILAWLPTLLAGGVAWVLTLTLVRPFLFEAFVVPTNAMAPTLLGNHHRSSCPLCGAVGYVSARESYPPPSREELGICGTCLRASPMPVRDGTRHQGDRLLAAKFLQPRRWDLIVFRFPGDPSISYVKRLVGLPGEEVAIRGGDVWINGRRSHKPNHISGLVYVADPSWKEQAEWGPAKLGRDEYFVLGDFSLRSKDSRLWETGAPGHPPYAVPKSYVQGVVTHIYWPPSRGRVLR